MSILTQKHILVIGEETDQISKIEAALITYGATITTSTCKDIDVEDIEQDNIDLILLNHLHDGTHCRDMLSSLRDSHLFKAIPVFALVVDDQKHIGDTLMLGAADYIVPGEDVHEVVEKMKVMFGDTVYLNNNSVIDLTPSPVSTGSDKCRVFVVEDDPLLSNLLAIKFQKSQVPFEISSDGVDLISKIKSFNPHIIILDLMLPGKDGFELLQEIRDDAEVQHLPVLIFSNRDSSEDRQKAEALGVKGFYVKAMTDLSDLMNTIKRHAKV